MRKLRLRLNLIKSGLPTLTGSGATRSGVGGYKRARYGGLTIDLPKLRNRLVVVAKNGKGEKVYHQQGDFDTLDLLTKRFNSKKRYSDLAVKSFNDLNELSGTPINRNSKQYRQLGRGTFYYNDPKELFERLELLGGSISAGNTSTDVKEDFIDIAHTLTRLGEITNEELSEIIRLHFGEIL